MERQPLNIIYHCYGGTHSSVLAACIHLGILKDRVIPTGKELLALPGFDERDAADLGTIHFYGRDEAGNRIFVLGRNGCPAMPAFFYRVLAGALQTDVRCLMVDTASCLNLLTRLGGLISCRLGLKGIGRPLLILGARLAYPKLAALVSTVRKIGA
ncbi:MAG: DUF3189 family protein [Desulfotomaculales bacterium]